jgi:hypothetical protein
MKKYHVENMQEDEDGYSVYPYNEVKWTMKNIDKDEDSQDIKANIETGIVKMIFRQKLLHATKLKRMNGK